VGAIGRRAAAVATARRWMRFLLQTTNYALCAPWLGYLEWLEEIDGRDRATLDIETILQRCDLLIHVGGVLTPEMASAERSARAAGKPVLSLLDHGEDPPLVANLDNLDDTLS
jgi:hypothetical protein